MQTAKVQFVKWYWSMSVVIDIKHLKSVNSSECCMEDI